MPFNTAIFYDIENLLKGYSFSYQMAANLSLAKILSAIKQTNRLSQVAVQRAYANWSDPRLAMMRGEINELGIEPIQVFGFSRDQKKNAADIQLAIDAIDLAYVRPTLDVFVIVSGDGGFASLAKKLHEYGKTVIGCAYQNAANRIFQAVCDDFVWIADPDEDENQERVGPSLSSTNDSPIVTDPRNVRLSVKIKPSKSRLPEDVLAKVKEMLNWYATDIVCRGDLTRDGIFLNVVQEAVKFVVPDFQSVRFGFAKFIEYLQYACNDSPLCVARPPNSQAVLALRQAVRGSVEILPDLDIRNLQTVEGYRSLLATGNPIIRFPPAAEFRAIAGWLCQHPPERADLGSIIESTISGLNGEVTSDTAKNGLLSLVSAQAFEREPDGKTLSEQKLTLQPDVRTPDGLIALVRNAARTKLNALLGQVREDILQPLFGENTPPVAANV